MHSQLAAATRPYIWREVLVALGSYDATEAGAKRLERAELPHNAPHVRALFVSFNILGTPLEDYVPRVVSMLSRFTALRAMCFGTFQSHSQPQTPPRLAAAIRAHPSIDTLVVWHMVGATDLIAEGSSRLYNIRFNFCHGGSAALLSKPKRIGAFDQENMEPQNYAKHMPARIWDTLEFLAPGYEDYEMQDHAYIQKSLKTYMKSGRKPALRALDLSHESMYSPSREGWLKLGRKLPNLYALTYSPRSTIEIDEAEAFFEAFPKVRWLHFVAVTTEDEEDEDSEDEDEDEDEDAGEFELDPEFVDLLSRLPVERLILDVFLPDYVLDDLEDRAEEFGMAAAKEIANWCEEIELVQFRFLPEDAFEEPPIVVEYAVATPPFGPSTVEVVEPKTLDGTMLGFLEWQ
ncbi:hypothetical protein R3P38DRAFT_3312529 [Favolaschia claudopus]|uniref:Uncharacterized protein n=1 Tax=Favolaschia claudopus TaxID=2862362 RepID=A0AAW0C5M2_9AGAR